MASKINTRIAGAPGAVKSSAAGRVMSILPRVIETAVEEGHKALKALRESAAKYAVAVLEARQAQSEMLLTMLQHVLDCVLARAAGAKEITNQVIDRVLIESGVKESVGKVVDGEFQIGSKSGAIRYVALVSFQDERLWTTKNADALRYIRENGIPFVKDGKAYTQPFDAISAGIPFTTVHDTWAKMVRALNAQVSPTAKVTPFERLLKMATNMEAADRVRLIASLTPTVSEVGKVEEAAPVEVPTAG